MGAPLITVPSSCTNNALACIQAKAAQTTFNTLVDAVARDEGWVVRWLDGWVVRW